MQKVKLVILIALIVTCHVWAYPNKDFTSSGQINDGDFWSNVNVYGNDTVVDMFSGWVLVAITHNSSTFNIYDGTIMDQLSCGENSIVNLYSGGFGTLLAENQSTLNIFGTNYDGVSHELWSTGGTINLYAINVVYDATGGIYEGGLLEGEYLSSGNSFVWDLYEGTYQYINIVPEPATFLLFGLGGFLLGKRS